MSTGRDCHFIETPSGKHYYSIEEGGCPDENDPEGYEPDMTTYGPFPSHDEAKQHLDQHHANPGGWSRSKLTEEPTGYLAATLANAVAPRARPSWGR